MRAMILKEFGSPLETGQVAEPIIGSRDALIKIGACGICRTDIKIKEGSFPPPFVKLPHIMGHEPAGEVVEVGAEVSDFKPGDRVVANPTISCGTCRLCARGRPNLCSNVTRLGFERNGAFAEYMALPAKQLVKVGDLPFDKAAVCTDAVVVPYHAIRHRAGVSLGDVVLVVGVGGLGSNAVQIAKLAGAYTIAADISDELLSMARELGADETVNSSGDDALRQVQRITGGTGVDIVIETVATPETLTWTLPCLVRGGRLVLIGYAPGRSLSVDSMATTLNEWEVIGSRGATMADLAEVVDLVTRGQIRPLVSKTFALEQVNEALDLLDRGALTGRGVIVL